MLRPKNAKANPRLNASGRVQWNRRDASRQQQGGSAEGSQGGQQRCRGQKFRRWKYRTQILRTGGQVRKRRNMAAEGRTMDEYGLKGSILATGPLLRSSGAAATLLF